MAVTKKKTKRRDYAKKEGTRQINVPVSEEVYQRVKNAAAGAIPGGMRMRYWIESALSRQAAADLRVAETE